MGRKNPNHRSTWSNRKHVGWPLVHDLAGRPQLTAVRPVAGTRLVPGTVVWAHIPYDDTHAEKTRPAVVESISGRDVTLLPATTSASRRRFADLYIELTDLAAAGLHRPTGIRRRPVTIDLIEVLGISGSLGDDDHDRLFAANHGYAAIGDAA